MWIYVERYRAQRIIGILTSQLADKERQSVKMMLNQSSIVWQSNWMELVREDTWGRLVVMVSRMMWKALACPETLREVTVTDLIKVAIDCQIQSSRSHIYLFKISLCEIFVILMSGISNEQAVRNCAWFSLRCTQVIGAKVAWVPRKKSVLFVRQAVHTAQC